MTVDGAEGDEKESKKRQTRGKNFAFYPFVCKLDPWRCQLIPYTKYHTGNKVSILLALIQLTLLFSGSLLFSKSTISAFDVAEILTEVFSYSGQAT